jgi:hypothetical protein
MAKNYMLLTKQQITNLPERLRPLAELAFDRRVVPLLGPMADGNAWELYGEHHNWKAAHVIFDLGEKTWIVICPDCGSLYKAGVWGDGMGGSEGYAEEDCGSCEEGAPAWNPDCLTALPRIICTDEQRRLVNETLDIS